MWLAYQTEAAAEAAQAAIWAALRPPHEMCAGQPVVPVTVRWATPMICGQGWAIPAPPDGLLWGGTAIAAPDFPPPADAG